MIGPRSKGSCPPSVKCTISIIDVKKLNAKTTLIAFFDINRLFHHELIPIEPRLNTEFCKSFLQCLQNAVCRYHPERLCISSQILHHETTPAHRHVITSTFLANCQIPLLLHLSFSLYLALSAFILFLQRRKTLKGYRFNKVEEIQTNMMRQMRGIAESIYPRVICLWQEQ